MSVGNPRLPPLIQFPLVTPTSTNPLLLLGLSNAGTTVRRSVIGRSRRQIRLSPVFWLLFHLFSIRSWPLFQGSQMRRSQCNSNFVGSDISRNFLKGLPASHTAPVPSIASAHFDISLGSVVPLGKAGCCPPLVTPLRFAPIFNEANPLQIAMVVAQSLLRIKVYWVVMYERCHRKIS